jgi:uncharacterized damage-inducible protein DinB
MNAAATLPDARYSLSTPVEALADLLEQLRMVLLVVPDAAYVGRPVPQLSGSVGEHVRHCLDHFRVLATAGRSAQLTYDQRRRGSAVETSRRAALQEIDRLLDELGLLAAAPLQRRVYIRALVHHGGTAVFAASSLARELAFVVQHTIHHFAVIGLLLHQLGVPVPTGFGLAPSTPRES